MESDDSISSVAAAAAAAAVTAAAVAIVVIQTAVAVAVRMKMMLKRMKQILQSNQKQKGAEEGRVWQTMIQFLVVVVVVNLQAAILMTLAMKSRPRQRRAAK